MALLIALLLAAAVFGGVPPALLGLGALAAWNPVLAVVAVVGVAALERLRRRRRLGDIEPAMLRLLGGELASGASVRHAVAAVAERYPGPGLDRAARLAQAGVPMGDVAARLAEAMPVNGRLLAAAITLGGQTGSGLSGLVQRLGERADRESEMRRELAAATVQARFSSLVIGVAPLVFTGFLIASGAVPVPWRSSGVLAAVSALGAVLEVAGFITILALLRRHAR